MAADAITAITITRHVSALAADSMHRDRPAEKHGAALERTARYVAGQLRTLGLEPGTPNDILAPGWNGDSLGLQHYPVPGQHRLDYQQSAAFWVGFIYRGTQLVVTERGHAALHFWRIPMAGNVPLVGTTVVPDRYRFSFLWNANARSGRPSVLVAGPHTLASIKQVDLSDKTILYVPPAMAGVGVLASYDSIVHLLAVRSSGVIVVSPSDSSRFASRASAALAEPPVLWDTYLPAEPTPWALEVQPTDPAVNAFLEANGMSLDELRQARTPLVQPLPYLTMGNQWESVPLTDTVTAPNVVATLRGSDSALQHQYAVIAVPLDGSSIRPADRDAGLASLLTLAQAFSQPGARPRYSLVFVATGGDDSTVAGGRYFMQQRTQSQSAWRTLPHVVLALDVGGDDRGDSLWLAGARELDLAPRVGWAVSTHPELGVTLVDSGSVLTLRSHETAFTEAWAPTLVFRAGLGLAAPVERGGSHALAAEPAAVRTLRMMFQVGRAVVEAEPLRWNTAARRQLAERKQALGQ